MQIPPPKYQERLLPQLEETVFDPLDHEEEQSRFRDSDYENKLCERLYTSGKQMQCDRGHRR